MSPYRTRTSYGIVQMKQTLDCQSPEKGWKQSKQRLEIVGLLQQTNWYFPPIRSLLISSLRNINLK